MSQTSPEPPVVNWSEEQKMKYPKYPTHGDDTPDSPKNINWVDNLYFDKDFGRIMLNHEEDFVEKTSPIFPIYATEQPSSSGQAPPRTYQRRRDGQNPTPFIEKRSSELPSPVSELIFLPEYDLDVNTERKLDRVMHNIPLIELMKIPSVKEQVVEFFESIPETSTSNGKDPSLPSLAPSAMVEEEEDPPINIQTALYERKNGGHQPFYLTLRIGDTLLHNYMLDSDASMNLMSLQVM